MFDIHSHILYDVLGDDGSKSMEESLSMAMQLVDSGFSHVIATPHYIFDQKNCCVNEIRSKIEKFNIYLKDNSVNLTVYEGHEVYSYDDIVSGLKLGKSLKLGGSDYVLIELPMYDIPLNFESIIFDMKLNGLIPILAHPERNKVICDDICRLDRFIDMGVLLQLNLRSLSGFYGEGVRQTAVKLLKSQKYNFIGSDGHDNAKKSMDVKKEVSMLEKLTPSDYFLNITVNNPQKMLKNLRVEVVRYNEPVKSEGFIKFLRRFGGVLVGQG